MITGDEATQSIILLLKWEDITITKDHLYYIFQITNTKRHRWKKKKKKHRMRGYQVEALNHVFKS